MSTALFSRIILFFEGTTKNSYHFFIITLQKGCQTAFYVSTKLLLEEMFFIGKKFNFRKSFDFDQKTFSLLKKVSAVLSELHSTCPGETLDEKVLGNLLVSFIFLILGQKNLKFRWKLFHSPSQLFIMCTRQKFQEKYVFHENRIFYVFRGSSQKFSERLGRVSFYLFTAFH